VRLEYGDQAEKRNKNKKTNEKPDKSDLKTGTCYCSREIWTFFRGSLSGYAATDYATSVETSELM